MKYLSTDDLENFASNFDDIKDLFDYNERSELLHDFQAALKKSFSSIDQSDQFSIEKAKLTQWKFHINTLQQYLKSQLPSLIPIISSIFSSIFLLSESAIRNWEKLWNVSKEYEAELSVKCEEITAILLASETLENKILTLAEDNESLSERLKRSQNELATTLELLQRENKTFLHKIIAFSKQSPGTPVPQPSYGTFRKEITPKTPTNTILMNNRIAQGRELSLKQLKDTIEEVYITKIRFDEKCRESGLPIETMDQFMYTYLNQKFGLKTIITEWTFSIMKAVGRYEGEDAEVKLFSKIIKHQINEDYRYVLTKVKEKIRSLLKLCVSTNSPYMREAQVVAKVKDKLLGKVEEREWTMIISSIYTETEAECMIKQIKENINERNSSPTKGKTANDDISFTELQNIILLCELTSHETLLKPFCTVFSNIDKDSDGLITQEEFKTLCSNLNCSEEIEKFISTIDPLSLNKISFSSCVDLFSNERISAEKDSFSILHSLYFSTQESQH